MVTKRDISRRDFLNGMALCLAGGAALSPAEILAASAPPGPSATYPPGLTGMRGSHAGSFEVAHALAREGRKFPSAAMQTGPTYDLVVVGGGISGLAAARFYRDSYGPEAKILVLDNHDDFGGHAKRNEFEVNGKTLVAYGGSQSLENPSKYSAAAKQLLRDLSIDVQRFYRYYDRDFYASRKLVDGLYFDRATYGVDRIVPSPLGGIINEPPTGEALLASVRQMPLPAASQDAFGRLLAGGADYLGDMPAAQRAPYLRSISYNRFLAERAGMPADVIAILQDSWLPINGVGWEAISAYDATHYWLPGTWALGLEDEAQQEGDPYIFHFPDGNAGVARSLVRSLVPGAIPGSTMEDLVTARADYAMLDRDGQNVRIRLNSTAVNVAHTPDQKYVDVTYVNQGDVYRARGRHVVLACYNNMIPYLCDELPAQQAEAIKSATKVPFVLGNFAIRNWRAFEAAGVNTLYSPGNVYFKHLSLDFPVSMGDYRFSADPGQPIVVSAWFAPTVPGLPAREQYKAGRRRLYEMPFDDFESNIYSHLDAMLGPHGFEAERDIAAITLNRWSHGYAYEYEEIGTPAGWGRNAGPHIAGRARIGRISIANSDSEAYAYVDGAIDAAHRAVAEQLAD